MRDLLYCLHDAQYFDDDNGRNETLTSSMIGAWPKSVTSPRNLDTPPKDSPQIKPKLEYGSSDEEQPSPYHQGDSPQAVVTAATVIPEVIQVKEIKQMSRESIIEELKSYQTAQERSPTSQRLDAIMKRLQQPVVTDASSAAGS
jgi:hypothetical protein